LVWIVWMVRVVVAGWWFPIEVLVSLHYFAASRRPAKIKIDFRQLTEPWAGEMLRLRGIKDQAQVRSSSGSAFSRWGMTWHHQAQSSPLCQI